MADAPKVEVLDPDAPAAETPAAAAPPSPTPTQEAINAALAYSEIIDDRGRKIILKKPSVLMQFRLAEVAGPERATNQALMSMLQPLTFVTSIGGEPVFFATKYSEIEALIEHLGEEGMSALMVWYAENVVQPFNDLVDRERAKDRLKNG